jgi:hypothetical protein
VWERACACFHMVSCDICCLGRQGRAAESASKVVERLEQLASLAQGGLGKGLFAHQNHLLRHTRWWGIHVHVGTRRPMEALLLTRCLRTTITWCGIPELFPPNGSESPDFGSSHAPGLGTTF